MYTSKCILYNEIGEVAVVTAKDLRLKTSQILKKVQQVGRVTVTLRGKPVATISALKESLPTGVANDPAYGMWADREDMKDVHAWLRKIRTPRYMR
ncbi:MAG: type II toxin-antitoxin system Phd/YefM family antitoxin [Terriglobia bacterium]